MLMTHWLTRLSGAAFRRTTYGGLVRLRAVRRVRRGARRGSEFLVTEALEQRVLLAGVGDATSEIKIASTPAAVHRDDGDDYPIALDDSDSFGRSMTNLGDLDGDGVIDIAVGATGDDDGGTSPGAVYVLFLNADGSVKAEQKISSTQGNLVGVLENQDVFGMSVASLGDLNGDGRMELAVGATGDDDGGNGRGAVYVLSLNANGTVYSYQKISSATGNLTTPLADLDGFGRSLANLGDLDGDGVNDLAVGASGDDDGGLDRGAVHILHLNANGTVKSSGKISSSTTTTSGLSPELEDQDRFGFSVTRLGDLDGDSMFELAVGATGDDDGGTDRGAVYVLFLNADASVKSHQKISSTAGNLAGPLDDSDSFGFAVADVGDFDGDGVSELAVGATSDDDGKSGNGAVYMLFLNPDGTVKLQQKIGDTSPPYRGLFFGASIAPLGDFDGDGVTDIGVGAYSANGSGLFQGLAYVVFLNGNGTEKSYKAIGDIEAPFDLGQTFFLNSLLGANHTIYLDFDGHVTPAGIWSSTEIISPAYDFDGDPNAFSEVELAVIQRIWQRVAEDFLPFNVNVTTQEPGIEALRKTGTRKNPDTQWGNRIVIGGSSADWYGTGAGGVAFIGSFNSSTDIPAFVFPADLLRTEKNVAEAISHEAGHTLGLSHDGRVSPSEAYYAGHGSGATGWAPIMGVGYYQELTQWSKGQYASANNTQDDLAIITGNNGFTYRADDHGGTSGAATALAVSGTAVAGSGIIERNTDSDWFSFTAITNSIVDLAINPAERGPNLDILARLYDATSTLIATSNPLDGLGAAFQMALSAGQYYLSITGTGKGDPLVDGYTNYASLGQYFVSGTVSAAAPNTAPVAEAGGPVSGSEDGAVTFDASGSFDADGDALTYLWDFGDGNTLTTSSPIVNHTYLWGGSFNVTLTVQDIWGGSHSDTTTASITEVNDVPVAHTGGTYTGVTGAAVSFSAAASSDFDNLDGSAANDQTLTYLWDFGDGNTATGVNVSHTHATAGNYTVSLTVSDGVDSTTATTSAGITTAPIGSENDLYVWDIAFGTRTRGKNQDLRVLVTIRRDSDADGIAEATDELVSGGSVTVVITGPKGGTFSGTTSSTGVFTSGWLTNVTPGLYTADVTSVTQSGRTWNPSLDVESIQQYTVSSAAAVNGRFAASNSARPMNGPVKPDDDEEDGSVPLFSLMA